MLTPLRSALRAAALERRRGAVDAQHLAAPAVRRAHAPGAHVAEHVQHARALAHVFRERAAIGGLIEKPAGLLPLGERRLEIRGRPR